MAALEHVGFDITDGGAPEEVSGNRVSANFFGLLGVNAASGRTFLPEDEKAGNEWVAVLSHSYWVSQFGSDPNVTGRSITLNDKPHVILGVLPADFRETFQSFPGRAKIWTLAAASNEDGTRHWPWRMTWPLHG